MSYNTHMQYINIYDMYNTCCVVIIYLYVISYMYNIDICDIHTYSILYTLEYVCDKEYREQTGYCRRSSRTLSLYSTYISYRLYRSYI